MKAFLIGLVIYIVVLILILNFLYQASKTFRNQDYEYDLKEFYKDKKEKEADIDNE
jgi:uncharacterized membrane protein